MNTKKIKFLVAIFCLFVSVKATTVYAGIPTFDAPKVVGDVVKSVSNFAKKVGEKLKDVQNKVMGKFIGKIKEAKAYAEKQKEQIEAEVDKAKADVEKEIAEAKKTKEEAEAYKAKAEKAIDDKKIYMEYSAAKTQVSSIKGAYDESVKAQENNYAARVSSVDQNIATLKAELSAEGATDEKKAQLEDAIVQLELSKKSFAEENQKFLLSLVEERDAALEPAEAEVSRIEKELKSKGMGLVESELGNTIDLKDPTAALQKMTEEAFVKDENAETVAKAKKSLKETYTREKIETMSDALRSYNEVAKQKKQISDPEKGLSSGVHMVEGFSAAATVSNDVKLEQARALLNYNRQMINLLKLRTAQQLVESTVNTVNEDQNLSTFSFDDYDYSTQCKGVR